MFVFFPFVIRRLPVLSFDLYLFCLLEHFDVYLIQFVGVFRVLFLLWSHSFLSIYSRFTSHWIYILLITLVLFAIRFYNLVQLLILWFLTSPASFIFISQIQFKLSRFVCFPTVKLSTNYIQVFKLDEFWGFPLICYGLAHQSCVVYLLARS